MGRTTIIASGAFLEPQLEAEFGRMPPAFLPLGNRRLYEHQRAMLAGSADRVILSVPDAFAVPAWDAERLAAFGIELVRVPQNLTLGQSIIYVINVSACAGGPVAVLHGDTLLTGISIEADDAVAVGPRPLDYRWGHVALDGDRIANLTQSEPLPGHDTAILTGWFAFSEGFRLVQAITRQGGDFLEGLQSYHEAQPLTALRGGTWFDFGHADTYHQSRRRVTTQRSFNRLKIDQRSVTKGGEQASKIEAEAVWFEKLPTELHIHTPALLGVNRGAEEVTYRLEYLHLPTLADLFVFGRLPAASWSPIFAGCDEVLSGLAAHPAPPGQAEAARVLYFDKTQARLVAHTRAAGLDLQEPCRLGGAWLPSLEQMVRLAAEAIPPVQPAYLSLVHGDFCFSNLLYDRRANLIKMIDPRGIDGAGKQSQFGDRRYDIGKMYHSVVGRYDHIVAGHYALQRFGPLDLALELPQEPDLGVIEADFLARRFAGLGIEASAAPAIGVLLFLSMLPLHADAPDRQLAFLANAMRLFLMLDGDRRLRSAA